MGRRKLPGARSRNGLGVSRRHSPGGRPNYGKRHTSLEGRAARQITDAELLQRTLPRGKNNETLRWDLELCACNLIDERGLFAVISIAMATYNGEKFLE